MATICALGGPNNNFWLTEATGMDANGCDMPSDGNFALFVDNGGCCGSAWGQNAELEIFSYSNFGATSHRLHLPAEQ